MTWINITSRFWRVTLDENVVRLKGAVNNPLNRVKHLILNASLEYFRQELLCVCVGVGVCVCVCLCVCVCVCVCGCVCVCVEVQYSLLPPCGACWSRRWSPGAGAGGGRTGRWASAPVPRGGPCGWCTHRYAHRCPTPSNTHTRARTHTHTHTHAHAHTHRQTQTQVRQETRQQLLYTEQLGLSTNN